MTTGDEPHGAGRGSQGAWTAAAGASCLGLGGMLVRLIALPAVALSFYRLWLGLVVLGAALAARGRRPCARVLRLGAAGGVCFATDNALFLSALKSTEVAAVVVIGSLQPVVVGVVAGRSLGDPLHRRHVACALLAVAGVTVISSSTGHTAT